MGWGLVEKLEAAIKAHNWWNNVPKVKAALQKDASPIRIGVLGAAFINYIAIFDPVESHPSTVIAAVAARSLEKAQAQIAKYKLNAKAYGLYDELLQDPDIDAVYIPLPNGLHCEWTVKALEAGKHVLVEKPIAANADEARRIRAASQQTGKVAVEAFHWRFHPAAHTVKEIVDSGKYGAVQSVDAKLYIPGGEIDDDDIRFNFALAGGACMDLTYGFCSTSHFASPGTADAAYTVLSATPRRNARDANVDDAMAATYTVAHPGRAPVTCSVNVDLNGARVLGGLLPDLKRMSPNVTIELERAQLVFANFPLPTLMHAITITEKDAHGSLTGVRSKQKCYKGGPGWGDRGEAWWTTYRYQLEAFVDRVKSAAFEAQPRVPWMSLDDSVRLMELIDAVYDKAGMPKRGTSIGEAKI